MQSDQDLLAWSLSSEDVLQKLAVDAEHGLEEVAQQLTCARCERVITIRYGVPGIRRLQRFPGFGTDAGVVVAGKLTPGESFDRRGAVE